MLALIVAFPLIGAILNVLLRDKPGRVVSGAIASAAVGASALLSFATFFQLLGHESPHGAEHGEVPAVAQTLWTWMSSGSLHVDVGFYVDPLAATMICIVTGIGFLIHVYSIGYMDEKADKDSVWRFFAYLNLFIFAMLLLVMGDSFPLMFVGWEGVGLCSYLLIGYWYENVDYVKAGKKAFVVNRIGDLSFIIGMFLLFWSLGEHPTLNFAELRELIRSNPELLPAGGVTITAICLLFFGGATGKSAQIPLYVWLPDAMAGPTPVSALIHAATMVTSGIYMVCRLNFLYIQAPAALAVVATIGCVTAFVAATIAITQNDIKKVLAYSTVSQLGYMFLGVGVGSFVGGFFHVLTHAFFKALMFLGAGSIIHALHHEQDMRHMGGLRKYMPVTFATFMCGYLAIIGFPGTSGFFSKDEILWLTWSTPIFADLPGGPLMTKVLWALGTISALLTAFYMSRLMFMTFFGSYRGGHGHHGDGHDAHGHHHTPHESPAVLTGPLVVLAIGAIFAGLLNLPHWLPGAGWLHHFLDPVFSDAHVAWPEDTSMEFTLMGITLAGIAATVGAAWWLYGLNPDKAAGLALRMPRLYEGSFNKWFVDEIYEATILKPIVVGSRQVLWAIVDAQIIDGAVNGIAAVAQRLGVLHGRIASGRVQVYALSIAAGTALIVTAYALGS